MFNTFLCSGYDFLIFSQRVAPRKLANSLDINSVIMIIVGVAVIAVLATIAYYVISNLRKNIKESDQPPSLSDHLTTFQEAKADGNMTAQEFNRVRAHLSKKIIKQVKEKDTWEEPEDEIPKFTPK